MAASIAEGHQHFGKLVALEGDEKTIEIQLRLLPPSEKILVLPSFTESLPKTLEKQTFDAHAFVRDIYSTFVERTESARSFLKSSTSTQPRLVFLNGGSICARATCITGIRDNLTDGDIVKAETTFNEIVQDGVAGLLKQVKVNEEVQTELDDGHDKEEVMDGMLGDPTTKAMQAAASLDRQTAALQKEGKINGYAAYSKSNYSAAEISHSVRNFLEASEESPHDQSESSAVGYGSPQLGPHGDDIITTVVTMRSRNSSSPDRSTGVFSQSHTSGTPFTSRTDSTSRTNYTNFFTHQADSDADSDYDEGLISSDDEKLLSLPAAPGIFLGEARVVDVQAASPTFPIREARRVRSVDGFHRGRPGFLGQAPSKAETLRHTSSSINLGASVVKSIAATYEVNNGPPLPKMPLFRASQTTVIKPSSVGSKSASTLSTRKSPPRVFVDRGTDAEVTPANPASEELEESEAPFEPVFALVEDLVIHFNDAESKEILESVIQSYKNESYPIFPTDPDLGSEVQESPLIFNEGIVDSRMDSNKFRSVSQITAATDDEEFDLYSPYDCYPAVFVRQQKLQHTDHGVLNNEPPTPSTTPPPHVNHTAEKFVSFRPVNPRNAISVQNSLREILKLHFPPGENGYSQHYYPVAPEMERLWKPVFRNDDSGSFEAENRTVDQIIALGCEAGVKKDFFDQISGQVERLGAKKDGHNRSAKVDIRYLIANVMQSFSTLPLTAQSAFNPLSNPTLMATLIVPELETYLASNASTRLLILQYSSDHLATVLALRTLLGVNLFKVAGILDSLASDPPSILSGPRPSTSKSTSNETPSSGFSNHDRHRSEKSLDRPKTADRNVRQRPSITTSMTDSVRSRSSIVFPRLDISNSVSFSKANFLLPSTATDTEITTFLSGIWNSLMEKSMYYTPEPEPKPIVIEKIIQVPAVASLPTPPPPTEYRSREAALPPPSFRPAGQQSKISRLTGSVKHGYATSLSPSTKQGYAPSIASCSSVKTKNTTASRRGDRAWDNFYIAEEDSDDDAYDKMTLGREFARITPEARRAGRRPTKKALKWLGLV